MKFSFLTMTLVTAMFSSLAVVAAQDGHSDHPHPPMNLTDAQKTCLEGILGKPGEGPRPERAVTEAAFKTCNVELPPPPPNLPPKHSQNDSSGDDSAAQ